MRREGRKVLVRFNEAGEIEDYDQYENENTTNIAENNNDETNFSVTAAVDEFYENLRQVNAENADDAEKENPKRVQFKEESDEEDVDEENFIDEESDFRNL